MPDPRPPPRFSPQSALILVLGLLLIIRELKDSSIAIKSLEVKKSIGQINYNQLAESAYNQIADTAAAVTSTLYGDDASTMGSIESIVNQCKPKTQEEIEGLKKEIKSYEKSDKFEGKKRETKGKVPVASVHREIAKFIKRHCLRKGMSVLELGAAAGTMLRLILDEYNTDPDLKGPRGLFQGVELVPGWVEWASRYFTDHKDRFGNNVKFTNGDITDFDLGHNGTFDFVMLNDVMEHIQRDRYGCLFGQLQKVTHQGSVIYMHTPTPEAQIADSKQYYENILPHHILISGMALKGFQLVLMQHDKTSQCPYKGELSKILPKELEDSGCSYQGWTKYYHIVFVRSHEKKLFSLS